MLCFFENLYPSSGHLQFSSTTPKSKHSKSGKVFEQEL